MQPKGHHAQLPAQRWVGPTAPPWRQGRPCPAASPGRGPLSSVSASVAPAVHILNAASWCLGNKEPSSPTLLAHSHPSGAPEVLALVGVGGGGLCSGTQAPSLAAHLDVP